MRCGFAVIWLTLLLQVRGLLSLYPDSPAGVLLKCELEVLRQLPRKALKTLTPLLAAPESCTQR